MPLLYLFGPVSGAFAAQKLNCARQAGECLAFNAAGDVDLRIDLEDAWEAVRARFPAGWQPDFIALNLPYNVIPECLWSAGLPLVGLAGDWNLHWHGYRQLLRNCVLVFADAAGVEVMQREGIHQARAANLYGLANDFLTSPPSSLSPLPQGARGEVMEDRGSKNEDREKGEGSNDPSSLITHHSSLALYDSPLTSHQPRDIDILFTGSLHPAIQRERLAWMTRLAALGERRKVVIRTDVFGDAYKNLLSRGRIVFNRSVRGECNQRVFEAAAAGALLFQEAGNREVPTYFRDRQHCIYYTADNLKQLLEYFLDHEDERCAIAEAAQARVADFTFENLWQEQVNRIEREWPSLVAKGISRQGAKAPSNLGALAALRDLASTTHHSSLIPHHFLSARTWQYLSVAGEPDPGLIQSLEDSAAETPGSASLHNALGVLTARIAVFKKSGDLAQKAIEHFRSAAEAEPDHAVARLNLSEALAAAGRFPEAIDQSRQVLALLDAPANHQDIDLPLYPSGFDYWRVEWERAAWENAGEPPAEEQAKLNLLRCRLHFLLARKLGDFDQYRKAAELRTDLGALQGSWGFALHRSGRDQEAIALLRREVSENPFDLVAARTLFEALGTVGDVDGQQRLADDRRLLARAAPQLVPEENWFRLNSPSPRSPLPSRARKEELKIIWEGSQLTVHSFDLVNRELCRRLVERGNQVHFVSAQSPSNEVYKVPQDRLPVPSQRPMTGPVDAYVRHGWPPNFTPPPTGHWVIMQPWEFGSLPKAWIEPMTRDVDEIWVYTHYVRQCYIQSGVPEVLVKVVPLGVDVGGYCPEAPPFRLRTQKRFKFLFVGGTIPRKGIDVLLEAYTRAFTARDDVCLVIKDFGASTFYKGQTGESRIAQCQAPPQSPEIEYILRSLTEEELAGLYTSCDCLVHPYRGEGFGLPIAEAMASGLAVVVTNYGAALDFCNESNAYLIPSRIRHFKEPRVGSVETIGLPFWAEPDLESLQRLLRHIPEHPGEARLKGAAARDHIRNHFTWDHAAAVVEARTHDLRSRPIRRFVGKRAMTQPHGPMPASSSRSRVSLCLIVKNEAKSLPACLTSVADLVDEMVVVDTGSSDGTRETALQLGARVVDFAWINDFSAARNESVHHASGEWIFWLDADERLDEVNRLKVRELFSNLKNENAAYVMTQQSVQVDATRSAMAVPQVRLFRRDPAIRWHYRVHEQILLAIRAAGHPLRWTDIAILHDGYLDPEQCRRKLERNVRLLLIQNASQPDDPITLYHLGWAYEQLGRPAEALPFLHRSLERVPADYSIRPKLHLLIGRGHHRLGQRSEALAACRGGRLQFPDDVELPFLEGVLLHEIGDLAGAEACFLQVLKIPVGERFTSVDAGLRTYKARHQLALIFRDQGRRSEAEDQWRSVLAEQPGFWPAKQGLDELKG